jgi:hypothetical protein
MNLHSFFANSFKTFVVSATSLYLLGCGYTLGYRERNIPGGYNEVAVPIFENATSLVGIEGAFTNELVQRFNRSRVAVVLPKDLSPVFIQGVIKEVKFDHGSQIDGNNSDEDNIELPDNTVLTVEYRLNITADISLIRTSDKKVLWQGRFQNERVLNAPQIGLSGINSANALYAQNAKLDLIKKMAADMMGDAHDRMTENF